MSRILGVGVGIVVLVAVVAGIAVWATGSDREDARKAVGESAPDAGGSGAQPGGMTAGFGISGIIEYTVRDPKGKVRDSGIIHNTVNDPEALNEVFNRITGTSSGGAYDAIGAVDIATGLAGGITGDAITENLDGDSGTGGNQNPADDSDGAATDFGTESGNGQVAVTFTAQAVSVNVTQIFLTKDTEQTISGAGTNIPDSEVFAYVDVPDIILNTGDSVTYTWTVDVD